MSGSAEFDVERRWPAAFAPLTDEQRYTVVQTLASSWHEGWEPNEADVRDLAEFVSGQISEAEYDRRTADKAARTSPATRAG